MDFLTFEVAVTACTALVVIAGVVVKLTKTQKDDKMLDKVKRVLTRMNLLRKNK